MNCDYMDIRCSDISCDLCEKIQMQAYNKAIDDFVEKIQWEYLNSCGIKQREIEFLMAVSSQVAEQLKAGEDNV